LCLLRLPKRDNKLSREVDPTSKREKGTNQMSNLFTCFKCYSDMEEDDVVWADINGDVNKHTYAYCVPCLPNQVSV
jgi:hypothetical protein